MKITFLGVSSAFEVGDGVYQTNMMIESGSSKKMLIDCGSDIRHSLFHIGYSHHDIEAVYISHLHADHVGGLEWLALNNYFVNHKRALLFISQDQEKALWDHVLSGGLSCIQGKKAELATFFKVVSINHLNFSWENIPFRLVKTCHSYDDTRLLPSYGLIVEGEKYKIFISTDMRYSPALLQTIANKVDIIFHDCELSKITTEQHARYMELNMLDPKIKSKMWLCGYQNIALPEAKKHGFQGFVTCGQSFEF